MPLDEKQIGELDIAQKRVDAGSPGSLASSGKITGSVNSALSNSLGVTVTTANEVGCTLTNYSWVFERVF